MFGASPSGHIQGMSRSLLSRVASFARSPQGRRLAEQARRAAKDPRNRARIEQVRAQLAKRA
jgi:capsule polysaccharide export protein KpsE/RkpR